MRKTGHAVELLGRLVGQEAIRDLRSGLFGNLIGNPISVALTLCTQNGPRTVQPNIALEPVASRCLMTESRRAV